jgi:hypothetical protein
VRRNITRGDAPAEEASAAAAAASSAAAAAPMDTEDVAGEAVSLGGKKRKEGIAGEDEEGEDKSDPATDAAGDAKAPKHKRSKSKRN